MSLRNLFATAALTCAAIVLPAAAQMPSFGIKPLLGQASDAALDKLSQPGAFSSDSAIRIALPGAGNKNVGKLLELAQQSGLSANLDAALNRAAEQAAAQAKPIFRAAIDKATLNDAVDIARGGSTGATDYLRKSTGSQITAQLQPLVRAALQGSGVLQKTSQLQALGFDEARLTDYVAGKTSEGIFTYVGREETRLRQDPIGTGTQLLKGFKF
ncbi:MULTISPECIES: DUF4197 domain-containing protein [unclassified Acidovorax]|uniref:DUF4197 domain-containing protein n=1 Tax=unclassified Acidovorax TaxID=2684926 RepID=UPI002882E0F6|nr:MULTISPECIES: DUF4197 domain-containing protein [unclassified Acidovorax]